jgi:hypothetical protein
VAVQNRGVKRALLLVDVIKDFEHEDGERLFQSFRSRHTALLELLEGARREGCRLALDYLEEVRGVAMRGRH